MMIIVMMIMMMIMIQVTDVNDRRLMRSLLLRVYNDKVANTPGCSLSDCGNVSCLRNDSTEVLICLIMLNVTIAFRHHVLVLCVSINSPLLLLIITLITRKLDSLMS